MFSCLFLSALFDPPLLTNKIQQQRLATSIFTTCFCWLFYTVFLFCVNWKRTVSAVEAVSNRGLLGSIWYSFVLFTFCERQYIPLKTVLCIEYYGCTLLDWLEIFSDWYSKKKQDWLLICFIIASLQIFLQLFHFQFGLCGFMVLPQFHTPYVSTLCSFHTWIASKQKQMDGNFFAVYLYVDRLLIADGLRVFVFDFE